MPGDYSQNRSTSRANRPPVNRNNPRTSVRKTPTRYVDGPAYPRKVSQGAQRRSTTSSSQNRIKFTRRKKELKYAQARRKFYIWGLDGEVDMPMFFIIIILLAVGIASMFSASYFWGINDYSDGYHYLKIQLTAGIIGLIAMIVISKLDYHFLQNTVFAYVSFAVVLIINLITAFVGFEVAGARRWIGIFGQRLQPSEIMKITLIIVLAYILSANYPKFNDFRFSILPCTLVLGVCAGAAVLQRHMSLIVIMGVITVCLLFIGGIPKKHFVIFCSAVAVLGIVFLGYKMITSMGEDAGFGYITKRIAAWKDPLSDISDSTNQIYNSLIAIGSGGVFGLGIGESRQKFLWLSEAHNDYVFAIVCEEMGFIGGLFVIALFVFFIYRGFYIASKATDRFGMLLAAGITTQIGIQALLNIAVATNTIPSTGISLPFFSYGGTALAIQLCEMGLLLSVSKKTRG